MRFFTSFWILILILFSTHVGWGQVFSINGGGALPSGWQATNNVTTEPIDKNSYYLLEASTNGDVLVTSSYDLCSYSSATFSVDIQSYGSGVHNSLSIEVSTDGGTNYQTPMLTSVTTSSYITYAFNINSVSANVRFRLKVNATSGRGIRLQKLILTGVGSGSCVVTTPPDITSSLTASGSIGSLFTYSTTATNSPTGFSATGLPPGLSINSSTGVISGTPTVTGSYSVTLTASNAHGVDTETLVITITAAGVCLNVYNEDFSNIGSLTSYGSPTWNGVGGTWSATQAREDQTLNGKAITIKSNGVLTSPTFNDGISDLTFKLRFPFSESSGTLQVKVNNVTVGTVLYSEMNGGTAITKTFTGIDIPGNIILTFTSTGARFAIDDVNWTCNTSPSISSPTTSLSSFNYCFGSGPSAQQNFTISGSNLTDNITVTPPTNYEISTTSGSGFTSSAITLTHSSGIVASTTIYTRLKAGLAAGNYNGETIAITSTDATSKSVTLNGSVTAPSTPTVSISASTNSICPGTNVTFTATPSNLGGGTASYQWKKNGSDVGTGTTYATTSLANDDVITCVMTVAGGCVSSATANSNSITITIYPEATVTFNKNAASATGTMANQTACQATNLTSNAYTNSGFTFSGWNTQPDGTGTSYADGQSYAFTTSITLYAIWDVYLGPCLQQLSFSGLPTSWIQTDVIFTSGEAEFDKTSGELTTISVAYPTSLSFSLRRTSNATNKMMYVEVATSLAGPYTQVGLTYDHSNTTSNGTTNITVDLMAYNIYPEVYVRFKKVSSTTSPWYLRNIEIYCQASCAHTITGFNPENGPVGTEITITGTGFTPSTIVKIGGQLTSVTYVNSTTLIAEILPGTTTGEIIIVEDFCYVDGNTFTVTSNSGSCPSDLGGLSDVFISEVFDSNVNNNWYMELFNPTNSTIDLAAGNYQIIRYASIGGGGVATTINLTGVIPPMSVFKMRLGSSSGGCSGLTFDLDVNGGGINENNEIGLYRNGVLIDIVHTPNETGYSLLRDNQAIAPSSTFSSSDWTTLSDESCNDFGVFSLPDLVPEISIITSNGCANLDFSVTATPGSGGTLTYKWYFNENNGIAGDWIVVSSANLAGLVVSGETTNNLIINAGTSPISSIENYQFYCEVTESGSCSNVSNAERFNPEGERYYKSTQSGNWTTVSTWLMAPAVSGPWSAACTYPTATNSDYISIENGHTVTLDIDLDADQIIVQSTGTLVLNEKLTVPNGNASTEDLLVEGTLIDNGNTTNGIAFVNGGTWLLGTQGTIIKTWSSDVLPFKNNYQGGISTIPATAHWYYRYVGNDLVVTTTVGMYYPNLYFESSAGFHAWDAATEVLSGSTATAVVKGNLSIGATNTGTVEVFNNNTFASPILVHGNVYVGAGSALRNTSQGGGIGTGFEIKGETIEIEGNYVMESGTTGKTVLSGAVLQTIVSLTGNGQFLNAHVELNNTNDARLNGIDMDISSTLTFTDGVIHTILAQADKVNITNSSNTAIINGQAESAQNRYINGKLQWNLANGNVYTFPVGYTKGTVGAQGFNFTVDNGAGAVLAYLEPNSSAPLVDYAYCDFEQVVGATSGTVGSGSPGYDGILDQIEYNIHSPLQWNITNPTGGSITQYDIRVLATGLQDITPVVSANNVPVRYLMRNGQPGNPTVPTLTAPGFTELGFEMCPNQYTLLNMTGFSFFTLDGATQNGTVLPIEVVSFTGEAVDNNAAILNWITATELNNDFFTLFYSNDGFQFEELVRIAGAGTSTQTNHYIYRHTPLSKGVHYYKLFSTDYDGTTYYRGIVAVQIEGVQAYFNTITSTIELAEKDDVKLYTTDGKLIAEGTNVNSIPVNHKGVFLLHYVRSGKTERLVIY